MSKRRDREEHDRTVRLLDAYLAEQDRKRLDAERKRRDEDEHDRTVRLLEAYIAEQDRKRLTAERNAAPLVIVTFCELADKDLRFVGAPWRRSRRADAHVEAMLRCDARAIARSVVRHQPDVKAVQRLHEKAPIPASGRYLYTSARARQLAAWIEAQPRSNARECLLRPLRRAVARKNAFAILFDTV